MKLLWVVHNLAYPPVRGVLQRNFNLLREAAKGAEVHVLAFDQPASRPAGVSIQDCISALLGHCASVECIPLANGWTTSRYRYGLQGLLMHSAYDLNWLSSRRMAERIAVKTKQTGFDVIHFDTLGLAPYRRAVSGVGTVLNHHNIESSMMLLRATNEPRTIPHAYFRLEAQKLLRAEQKYCPEFSVNFVVSPDDGELLERMDPRVRTRVIANGVDTEFFTPRTDPGGKTLLFCGGLDWYPNGDAMSYFFEQMWPRLCERMDDVRVVIVGRNPPSWLSDIAAADRRVQVTGFVDDVRPYFRSATAYICPIRVGGGTRLKILDAMAMGMPLISTSFACSGISVEGNKNALLGDTPEEFVNQIVCALSDAELRARLGAAGRELVCQHYSWVVVGRELRSAYQEAASVARLPHNVRAQTRHG